MMHGPLPDQGNRSASTTDHPFVAAVERVLTWCNSIIVVLAAIGFDPWNIIYSIRLLFQRLWDLGFDAVNWLWRYFLLGAVIVIPVWLLMRVFGTPRGR